MPVIMPCEGVNCPHCQREEKLKVIVNSIRIWVIKFFAERKI